MLMFGTLQRPPPSVKDYQQRLLEALNQRDNAAALSSLAHLKWADIQFTVNIKDGSECPLLHFACERNMLEVVRQLLLKGADITIQKGEVYSTLLHEELIKDNPNFELIKVFITNNPSLRESKYICDTIPLHMVAENPKFIELLRFMLELKEDNGKAIDCHIDIENAKHETTLSVAAKAGNPEACIELLRHGAKPIFQIEKKLRAMLLGLKDERITTFIPPNQVLSLFDLCAQVIGNHLDLYDASRDPKRISPEASARADVRSTLLLHAHNRHKANPVTTPAHEENPLAALTEMRLP